MAENKIYKVLITETLQKTVLIEARSEAEAHARVEDAWKNTEYIIDAECFQGVEFYVLGEYDGDDAKGLTHVERKNAEVDSDGNS